MTATEAEIITDAATTSVARSVRAASAADLRLTVPCKALRDAVTTALRAVPVRSALPIQSHLLLTTAGESLRVTGADYELRIERTLPAQVLSPGSVTVLARVLHDLLSTLPDADIELSATGTDRLTLVCGQSEYELLGLPAEEFPPLPVLTEATTFSVAGASWRDWIRQTEFAASDDPSRPQLTGLNLVVEGASLSLCGAEMARLALKTALLETPIEGRIDAIIPGRAMVESARILAGLPDEPEIEIGATQNQVIFRLPNIVIVSRLIDGRFPNFAKVIPKSHDRSVTVKADVLLSACKRSLVVAGDSKRLLFQVVSGLSPEVTIRSEASGTGKGAERIDGAEWEAITTGPDGKDFDIALDGKLLCEYLAVVGDETVVMEMTTALSPITLRLPDDPSLTCIQMPMHLF